MPVFKPNDVFAGRYILTELIGEGGFSEVWKATDQMTDDAVVALKIYAPEKGLDDYGVRQFRREFSLTHHLSHPHLLKVYHFDISEGSPYLIMPYCSLGSLNKLMGEEGSFSERQVALILCQVGSALEELHSQDPPILHQDIKPDNILLSQPEYFLLGDFGISSQLTHTLRKSTSESRSLTVAYAPPERFDRFLVTDASGDIFSLGVTLFEMCTKTIPWDGSGGQSLLKGGHVPNLPERYSAELNKLLQACMSANRGKRPSANELHLRGKNFLETGQWSLPEKGKGKDKGVSQKVLTYVGVAAAVILIALGGYWAYTYQVNADSLSEGNSRKLAASNGSDQEVNTMLDKVMEEELKVLAKRTVELEEANKRLLERDSLNQAQLEEYQKKQAGNPPPVGKNIPEEKNTATPVKNEVAATPVVKAAENKPKVVKAAEPKPEVRRAPIQAKEIENQLNKISDPGISSTDRKIWKQETMDLFAEGVVRILDESEAAPKQYSASIFLNLLFNVPHNIEVVEVKSDQNKKITELRLTMTTRM